MPYEMFALRKKRNLVVLKYKKMTDILFNKKHLKEYAVYGSIAGIFHILTVWYFLHEPNNHTAPMLFIGSIFFMFVIMVYSVKLTKRGPDYKSTWGMLISGQMAVVVGVVVSVICSFILCCFYIPGFINGSDADNFLGNTPSDLDVNNTGTIELIFITATFENYGAGAFISAMIAYALKPDQTKDLTPEIFEEPVNDMPPSKEVVDILNPFPEINTSDRDEFLDDAIRMKEQPLGNPVPIKRE